MGAPLTELRRLSTLMIDCAGEVLPALEEARVLIPDDPNGSNREFICKLLRRDLRRAPSEGEAGFGCQLFVDTNNYFISASKMETYQPCVADQSSSLMILLSLASASSCPATVVGPNPLSLPCWTAEKIRF